MKRLEIKLPERLYEELMIATANSAELDEPLTMTPEDYARECVESVLATRRLASISA